MKKIILLLLIFSSLRGEDECPALLKKPEESKTFGEMRLQALKGWDKTLTWMLSPKNKAYKLQMPLEEKVFDVDEQALFDFNENYGYFSIHHPIVGILTKDKRDIKVTKCLLESVDVDIQSLDQRLFSSEEILAKVMAYRPLRKGMELSFSTIDDQGAANYVSYIVDTVIDLWHGMPAFGLVPTEENGAPPVLLYRGTDLSITSEKGWASILSDLDTSGPGHRTFLRAKDEIREWLMKMAKNGSPARVIGFSLGGSFALYSMIYFPELINKKIPSIAFNPAGISKELTQKWKALPEDLKAPHVTFVNQGDFVSQVGYFLSNVWELSLKEPMQVIEAHVTLISSHPYFRMTRVDLEKENQSR